MTLHESKHAAYTDHGRLHFASEAPLPAAPPTPEPSVPMPPLPGVPQAPPPGASPQQPAAPPSPGGQQPQPPVQQARQPASRHSQRALYKHADLAAGGGEDCFARLARLAEPEYWAGRGATRHDETWVLQEYVESTFERLHQQRKVITSPDGGHSVFNTGLATAQQETIYGLFTPNNDPDGPPWQLNGWYPEGDGALTGHFPELPDLATYTDDPAELVYDWRLELTVNPKQILETRESLAVLPGPLRSNPYQASLVIEGAVRRAEARVRRSYRAAVPCWDPEAERVRLLLPVSLTTPESVDVALVIAREGDGYRGYTVLGLDLAYARARLIARLEEWLTSA